MLAYVVSVPATGTNTLEVCLAKAGYSNHRVHTSHMKADEIVARWSSLFNDRPAIHACPLRHPKDVWVSWKKRGKRAAGFDFLESWQELQKYIDMTGAVVIPFDIPHIRDLRLAELQAAYRGEIENKNSLRVDCDPLPPEIVSALNLLPVLQNHYGDIG